MATIMVSYDLHKPVREYGKLIAKLEEFATYWHCLESTWFVKTSLSSSQVLDQLLPFVDEDDEIIAINPHTGGWASFGFDKSCTDWLKNNL